MPAAWKRAYADGMGAWSANLAGTGLKVETAILRESCRGWESRRYFRWCARPATWRAAGPRHGGWQRGRSRPLHGGDRSAEIAETLRVSVWFFSSSRSPQASLPGVGTLGISPPSFSHLSIARRFKALRSPMLASVDRAKDSGATEFHKAIAGWSVRSCS
jgi:hypothetical protein